MSMTREQLQAIIERYTPTMLDVISAASADEIARLQSAAGPLPEAYLGFLSWMGNRCPFLIGAQLAYTPAELLEVYEDPEDSVPDGFILIGIDTSGNGLDVHIRREDGIVLRLSESYDGVTDVYSILKSRSFPSFLATTYVEKTLVPSHPFKFACAFEADAERTAELWRRVDEACSHFEIPYSIVQPDFRFYGGVDFVLGLQQRPQSNVVNLNFGSIDRARYEVWYDLVFARWRLMKMPVLG